MTTHVVCLDGTGQTRGQQYPTNIALDKADGNSIILDLGHQRYAAYAHMQPGSLKVHRGDKVQLGQVIGLVGDTGNSVVPHLHFQVTDGPSSLSSNGFPYEISEFQVTGATAAPRLSTRRNPMGLRFQSLLSCRRIR